MDNAQELYKLDTGLDFDQVFNQCLNYIASMDGSEITGRAYNDTLRFIFAHDFDLGIGEDRNSDTDEGPESDHERAEATEPGGGARETDNNTKTKTNTDSGTDSETDTTSTVVGSNASTIASSVTTQTNQTASHSWPPNTRVFFWASNAQICYATVVSSSRMPDGTLVLEMVLDDVDKHVTLPAAGITKVPEE